MVREPVDAEKIGAVLDGTAGQERDALLARLAADEDDYDVFADTAAVLREIEDEAASVAPETADVARELTAEAKDVVPVAEVPAGPSVVSTSAEVPAAPSVAATSAEVPAAPRVVATQPEVPAAARDAVPAPAVTPAAPNADGVIPLRPRRSVWTRPATRWLAAAAVLATVAVPVIRSRAGGDAWRDSQRLVTAGERNLAVPKGWTHAGSRSRGPEQIAEREKLAAFIGTLHLDLEAMTAGPAPLDTAAISQAASEVGSALDQSKVTGTGGVSTSYRVIADSARRWPVETLQARLARARRQAAQGTDPDYFALGGWVEAARLAAARQDESFFHDAVSRQAAAAFAVRMDALPPDAREAAAAVRRTVKAPGEIRDWQSLRDMLDTLQRRLTS